LSVRANLLIFKKFQNKSAIEDLEAILIDIPGLADYERIWSLQLHFHNLRTIGKIPNVLIFVEHQHVYTIGKAGDEQDLKVSKFFLEQAGAKIYQIDRGGKITYHGPGQIVGYPIFKLDEFGIDVHTYLRKLEEVIILTLKDYGIDAERKTGLTGVWVKDGKIASIGIKVSRWVTMHGFALNVNTDLKFFDLIFPCGLKDVKMTSMKEILKCDVDMDEVKLNLKEKFERVFGVKFVEHSTELVEKNGEFF
jgi:lipoyl(octanoyl) transferase